MYMYDNRMMLLYSFVNMKATEGIEKSYLRCFNNGTAWKQLLFWLGKPFSEYFICILFPQHDHMFTDRYTEKFIMEMLTHACVIGTRPLGHEA